MDAEPLEPERDLDVTTGSQLIKRIDRNVVHRICSGQVIVTLSTAIKELVENSIDAGARSVEIRLVEYGSKSIEVIDNGSGVKEEDFEGLCMKHHTSKISSFEDVSCVSTFGFRGEALSSLCALSTLQVITKHKASKDSGFCIDYDHRGNITLKKPCPRESGTTIVLKNIFSTLPVRHNQFIKNLKREYQKMINVLYGYCLIAEGVRISCTNQLENGSVAKVLNVPASNSVENKIASLFGSKQCAALMPVNQVEDDLDDDIKEEFGLKQVREKCPFSFKGFVSAPQTGRRVNDRQYIFINSRPCDSIKISRIVNETYQSFCRNQYPFVFLDIKTVKENVDVNVNPDKRLIFIKQEALLYASIKCSLMRVWEATACPINQAELINAQEESQLSQSISKKTARTDLDIDDDEIPKRAKYARSDFAKQYSSPSSSGTNYNDSSKMNDRGHGSKSNGSSQSTRSTTLKQWSVSKSRRFSSSYKSGNDESHSSYGNDPSNCDFAVDSEGETPTVSAYSMGHETAEDKIESATETSPETINESDDDVTIVYDDELDCFRNLKQVTITCKIGDEFKEYDVTIGANANILYCSCDGDERFTNPPGKVQVENYDPPRSRHFKAGISAEENNAAEQELKKYIEKDMFNEMAVLGQFNLGFIVVKHCGNLFLVDQHASDEKFNFESLEKCLVLQTQRLISPIDLQLPVASECVLIDRINVFRRNGFDFKIDPEGVERVQMIQIPYSKGCTFGKEDVEELIALLHDAPEDAFYRPTKVREMLASRACRKSVMIGTDLNVKEMRKIVQNMSTMKQPWNCPHGRPTIRHLVDLNMLTPVDWKAFNH